MAHERAAYRCLPQIAAALALVLGAVTHAHANDADVQVAEGIYQAAVTVYAKGHYREAIDLFVEANRLRPSAALSFNIARCYEKLNDPKRALAWYRDYLRRSDAPRDAVKVKRRIVRLERRLGRHGGQQEVGVPADSRGRVQTPVRTPARLSLDRHHMPTAEARVPGARCSSSTHALVATLPALVSQPVAPIPARRTMVRALGSTGRQLAASCGVSLLAGADHLDRASGTQVALSCTPSKVKASVTATF